MWAFGVVASLFGVAAGAPDYLALWDEFKVDYAKTYEANGNEESQRFAAFKANVDIIEATNAQELPYKLGLNEFADLTSKEFAEAYLGGYKADLKHQWGEGVTEVPFPNISGMAVADSIDWVEKGAVTAVKNQQQCGSCWAFSTTGAIEGAYYVASGELVSLSEEDLVQCDETSDGCQGGDMSTAFEWVQKNGGICAEQDYPYTSGAGKTGTCQKRCSPVVTVAGFTKVPKLDETALLAAVSQQPVSIAIEADKAAFQLYQSGVLTRQCGQKLDHGVLIVGYGTDAGQKYWKVKNSWGATWGEEGYVRLARGKDECGLAMEPVYPTGAKAASPGPAPGPSPGPSPPPPPSGASHYEDPADGCQSDEASIQIQSVEGSVCAPKCSALAACPTDVPDGVTATPQCNLQDASSGKKYCSLTCNVLESNECGTATCQKVQLFLGICTYDDFTSPASAPLTVEAAQDAELVI